MSLNIGGCNRKDNPVIVPTRMNNYVVPVNGSFQRASVLPMRRSVSIFSVKSKQQIEQERLQAEQLAELERQQQHQRIIAEQQAQRIAQQTAQAPAYHGVPSIYNQTGKKS